MGQDDSSGSKSGGGGPLSLRLPDKPKKFSSSHTGRKLVLLTIAAVLVFGVGGSALYLAKRKPAEPADRSGIVDCEPRGLADCGLDGKVIGGSNVDAETAAPAASSIKLLTVAAQKIELSGIG